MIIRELAIKSLYGKDYNMKFYEDLTILYGLNGSGKTTILNIIFEITQGNLKKVCGYRFKELILKFKLSSKNIEKVLILSKTSRDSEIYEVTLDGSLMGYIGEVNISNRWEILDEDGKERIHYNFSKSKENDLDKIGYNLTNEHVEFNFTKLICSKVESVYIPLDRKVKGLDNKLKFHFRRNKLLGGTNKKNIEDSLHIAEMYLEICRNNIAHVENQIHKSMRNEILNHLSRPMRAANQLLYWGSQDFTSIQQDIGDIIGQDVRDNIDDVIKIYKETMNSYVLEEGGARIIDPAKFIEHSFSSAQLSKFKEVAKVANEKKKVIDRKMENFNHVISSINKLLEDTGKYIEYAKGDKKLIFKNFNSQDELDITLLSSGEKQLIIFYIFSLIDDTSRQSKLLMVDEPELSLHIDWQAQLLPSVLEVINQNQQLVVATHSPDIIGDYHTKCVEVRGEFSRNEQLSSKKK